MLTRATTKIDWTGLDDTDWDVQMEKSDEILAAEEAAFDREMEIQARRYEQRLARMTPLQRYRWERHNLVVSALRCRVRRDKYRKTDFLAFMVAKEEAILKKRQMSMLDWRRFLVTGVVPSMEEN